MRLLIFIFFTYIGIIAVAQAQMDIDDGIRQPKTMMVAGDSVIDEVTAEQTTEAPIAQEPQDDAKALMDPETAAPVTPAIDPFQPAPETQQQGMKRVLKKIPAAESNRSIADERIDDGYVQQMIDKNFSYNPGDMTDID